MNKLTPLFIALSIVFASCSSNETEVIDTTQEKLLQSYTLKRDSNGAYSIDFNTTSNTDVTTVKNVDKSNEIILSETDQKTANAHSNEFSIENDQLKIGFLEANKGKRTQISIEDEKTTFAKGGVTEFLNSYSIAKNENGTFQLSFKVNDNVTTEFVYNEDIETYEVHLSSGEPVQKNFSRQIKMTTESILKIDFVNHKYLTKATEETAEKKPRLIFEII
jgi:hypothetical protein